MSGQSGFSLVEVIVASAILATALVGLAELMATGLRSNASAQDITSATMFAAQKIEELRAIEPSTSVGSVDYLDRWGNVVGTGASTGASSASGPPDGAVYYRRWSVVPLSSGSGDTFVFEVVAGRVRERTGATAGQRGPDEAWLVAAKTRTAR